MNFASRILFLVFSCGLTATIPTLAQVPKSTEFIVPLRTTRTEVESFLGPGEGECRCIYRTTTEVTTVRYAQTECDEGWAVKPDTVIRAETSLARPSREAFSLVDGGFVKVMDDATYITYINITRGLVFHTSPYGEVERIEQIPNEAQGATRGSRCSDAGQYSPFTRYYPVVFNYEVKGWPNDIADWNTVLMHFKNFKEKRLYVFVYFDGIISTEYQDAYIDLMITRSCEMLGSNENLIIKRGGKRDQSEVEVFLLDKNLPEPRPSAH